MGRRPGARQCIKYPPSLAGEGGARAVGVGGWGLISAVLGRKRGACRARPRSAFKGATTPTLPRKQGRELSNEAGRAQPERARLSEFTLSLVIPATAGIQGSRT